MRDISVSHNKEESRFEAHGGGQLMGYIEYTVDDTTMDLPHTKVFPEFEGQGVGSELARQTLGQIREMGDMKVTPSCPFLDIWIKRHKDYHDLLA